ncbi:D12 class N6 adenine-specific DNA methyltransferase [Ruminiclostridium sufflavum DSM 19573]|uniref:D12 class N6 adenine-specific DNA methyltransferase n=1 Tax=Ruminiclostridium sufflavum DSM 19573 TaxID=1121337 RepID=A0A318XLB1_9FIRM|nr:DNA adenine methylase [Ruminiclostridium sufflavum]PYG86772.1 D12 class N6 adenine-specific DNA methyltransferase [Ruminiclostridium sufflavum DSM 19573]
MKRKPTLSIAPYYGGKGRMAHFIADRLNYDDSDIFITPFGGMCRVLLNKPRHKVERYNDYSSALQALMRVLSDAELARTFIHRLYEETEYSQEEFDKQKAIYDNAEIDLEEQERGKLKKLLTSKKIVEPVTANALLDEIMYEATHPVKSKEPNKNKRNHRDVSNSVQKSISTLKDSLTKDNDFRVEFEKQLSNWVQLYLLKSSQGYLERTQDIGEAVSDIDLAVATYYVFQCSRDGMGQTYSKEKFQDTDHYLKQVMKLYDCAERLEGVYIHQIDAVDFFRRRLFVDIDTPIENVPPQYRMMNEWINNPRVMMYCDPSYISVEHEAKLLKDIDIDAEKSLSEAIQKKYDSKKMPKNLGEVYARSFGYDEQEKFLRCIQKAKCRILVSNYDLALYNKYLNEDAGWRREEFITTTGVGGKVDNTRVEVIWYNY